MRYTQKHINFFLDKSEYYDFELATDNDSPYGDYLFTNDLIIDVNICSGLTSTIRWSGATVGEEFDLDYITTTGLDNFFVNVEGAYTSGGTIDTGITAHYGTDEYFEFNPVSGWTTDLSYEITPDGECLSKLNGGFYQGFFKLYGYPYELAPTRMRKGWTIDMIVKYPAEKMGTGKTLNDAFPNNEGFIFYIGTRAEDKYWNGFTTGDPSETSILFHWSGLTITDPRYQTYYYTPMSAGSGTSDIYYYHPSETAGVQDYLFYHTNNQGYGMWPSPNSAPSIDPLNPSVNDANVYGGFTIGYAYGGGTSMSDGSATTANSPLYTHGDDLVTSGATGTTSYQGYYHYTNHKPYAGRYYDDNTVPLYLKHPFRNITDNALGVRIHPDGRIGYRVLRVGNICQTGTTIEVKNGITGTTTTHYKIEEGYSPSVIWTAGDTGYINITVTFERYIELKDCDLIYNKYRKGVLTIYVNARPVLRVDNFEEIIPHILDRQKVLQNGVPFNISWGGGTQGLYESVTFGGIDTADRNLMLQTLFAGSWMGELSTFKMYVRPLDVTQVIHNFEVRKNQYNMQGDFGGRYIFITKG